MSKVRTTAVDLFTPDEHAILAQWFGVEPPDFAQDIVLEEAISRLGFSELCIARLPVRQLHGQLYVSVSLPDDRA